MADWLALDSNELARITLATVGVIGVGLLIAGGVRPDSMSRSVDTLLMQISSADRRLCYQ